MSLSVCIITLNEEANIGRTLRSVQFADEIIVLDSGSTDRTVEIAQALHAKVFTEPWAGFAKQKNSAIDKCSGDWILSLDADEEMSPELQSQIQYLLPSHHACEAYTIPRRNLFLGRWMKHGGFYPDRKLRLFRRGSARFDDRPVHESMSVNGIVSDLDCDIIHHAYPTLDGYIRQMNNYSALGAGLLLEQKRTSRSFAAFLANVILRPCYTFAWNYIFRLGFLDGREGLLLHAYHSVYVSWKYAKAWRMERDARNPHTPRDSRETRAARDRFDDD